MKLAVFTLFLLLMVFLAIPVQEAIAPIAYFLDARVLVLPTLVCFVALSLPLPSALLVAVVAGGVSDAYYLVLSEGHIASPLGFSIVYFLVVVLFFHGFEPAYQRGHGWILLLIAPLATALYLLLTYGFLCLHHESFLWGEIQTWRIVGAAILSIAVALCVYLFIGLPSSWFFVSGRRTTFR